MKASLMAAALLLCAHSPMALAQDAPPQDAPPQDALPQDAPKDVLDFFRTAAEALADKDAAAFLGHFDRKMADYDELEREVRALLDRSETGSSIEIVSDEGNDRKRNLQLDWLLRIDEDSPRRQIVKCTIEKQGRRWRITSLEPVSFFRPR